MASQDVFISLQVLFPEVDHRILKAVSIEHANDVDAAVEFIVSDVLPRLSSLPKETQLKQSSHKAGSCSQAFPSEGKGNENGSQLSKSKQVAFERTLCDYPNSYCVTSSMGKATSSGLCVCKLNVPSFLSNCHKAFVVGQESVEYENTLIFDRTIDTLHCTSSLMGEKPPVESLYNLSGGHNSDQLFSDMDIGTTSLKGGIALQIDDSNSLHDSFQESVCFSGKAVVLPCLGTADDDVSSIVENMSDAFVSEACAEKGTDGSMVGSEEIASCSADPANIRDFDGIEYKFADKDAFHSPQKEFQLEDMTEKGADLPSLSDDDCQATNLSIRSSQIVSSDFLEDFIADTKTNKKILLSAMESTIDMMKDVELQEKRAKQAKEEASKSVEDILIKVEELREILKHSKEANDMHAGEVYGEKSILATEARELQSRLLGLSNEREKSLRTIKEIEETLKTRLATAENEIAAAEQEKLEKERLAQNALSEQEQLMDAIVLESKKLQQEAEENSKLREFLMERGQIVDTLQGEIAVICEDVLSLKEKVDGRIPLSRSFSSRPGSLASSLTSSNSSRTSLSVGKSPSIELKDNPSPSTQQLFKCQEPESSTNSGDITSGEKQVMDSDWELFECPILN